MLFASFCACCTHYGKIAILGWWVLLGLMGVTGMDGCHWVLMAVSAPLGSDASGLGWWVATDFGWCWMVLGIIGSLDDVGSHWMVLDGVGFG